MTFTHLPHAQILEVHQAAVDMGLAAEGQSALLAGLPPAFIAGLNVHARKDAELLDTLFALNAIECLEGGAVPLEVLLRNVRHFSRERPESVVFERALSILVGRRWVELSFTRAAGAIQVAARGSRGEATRPHPLDPEIIARLDRLGAAVQSASSGGQSLGASLLAEAQYLQRTVLGEEIEPLLVHLRAAARGPLLLRLDIADAALRAIPWEAVCSPGEAMEAMAFWASS